MCRDENVFELIRYCVCVYSVCSYCFDAVEDFSRLDSGFRRASLMENKGRLI